MKLCWVIDGMESGVIQGVSLSLGDLHGGEEVGEEFSTLEDPRCGGKVEHRLIDILVIAICAVIAGAESWEDIALYGRSKVEGLGTFLALSNGIPAHDTFRHMFMLINPGVFEACFEAWARSFGAILDREVVAIDRKTIRGSFDRGREQGPLHVISAWAYNRGLMPDRYAAGVVRAELHHGAVIAVALVWRGNGGDAAIQARRNA
jgi:hypothetical protein